MALNKEWNKQQEPDIAVLTPYKAQKKLMEDIVKEEKLKVTIRTINESQGDHAPINYILVDCHPYRK